MIGRGTVTVVDLDKDRLTALWGSVLSDRVSVSGWLSVARPDGMPADRAESIGKWVGETLQAAGAPRGRVVLAMPRGDVVLKRLVLPAVSASEADTGGIVRLQMSRQLTMPMEGTAVDYVLTTRDAVEAGAEGTTAQPSSTPSGSSLAPVAIQEVQPSTQSAMAGAMPADRVAWCRELSNAGELTLKRIALRCYGASALLAERSQRRNGPIVGVTLGWCSVEFVVVEDGALTFARAVDLTRPATPADMDGYAEKIAVEAKRTWMSHRATHGTPDAELVTVLGNGTLAALVAEKSAAQLGCGHELVNVPSAVTFDAGRDVALQADDYAALLPLIGLMLESAYGKETLDFANPRRAPDLGKAKRTRVLLGVFAAIVVVGGAYVASLSRLSTLESNLTASRDREASLKKDYEEFLGKHARLSHIEHWSGARVDWLGYLAVLNEQLPEPQFAVLDQLGAHMSADVVFASKGSTYPDGAWITRQAAAFSLDGKMAQRSVAADLRGKLLDLDFDNVESKGPDVPDRFSFVVTTTQKSPKKAGATELGTAKEAAKPGPGGASKQDKNSVSKPGSKKEPTPVVKPDAALVTPGDPKAPLPPGKGGEP